jgi:deoxyribodipyrimidine photo-lyase
MGKTGHLFIDAHMNELSSTGWMSNRGRQVVASYLAHHLHGDWRAGAAWFEHQLIDYDVASNYGNWTYLAGVGTDPRPNRVFNPDLQADRYDPSGSYRRKWTS